MEEIQQQLAAIRQEQEEIKSLSLLAAKNVLDINDVAVLTGFSVPYIYRLTSQHKIPYYKPNGKSIYFDRSELEAWMKQNRVNTTDEAAQIAAQHIASTTGNRNRAAASTNRKPAGARK